MSRARWGGGGILLIALPLLALLTISDTVLTATDLESGRRLLCRPVGPGDTVQLVFDNSMYGGKVVEQYVVTAARDLQRTQFATEKLAAAEYYAYDRPIHRSTGWFVVELDPEVFEHLHIQVDEIGRHRLVVSSEHVDLVDHVGGRQSIRLDVERLSAAQRIVTASCR